MAGGGPLMDLGIYCLQGICYTSGMEPIAVTAQSSPISDPEKFIDIEETLTWQMEMPGGLIAECKTSYTDGMNHLKVEAERGSFELQPSFSYSGIKGKTPGGIIEYQPLSQQAKQMDDDALSIIQDKPMQVPGEEGLKDIRIVRAIYQSAATGKRVDI